MKILLIRIVERIHLIFFGRPISDQMRIFLFDLSWSFYSSMVALPVSMVVGTLAGRFMGPAMFGQYNLVVIISSYIIVVAFSGQDISAVKQIVKAKDEHQKATSFFSAFVFISVLLLLLGILAIVFQPFLTRQFSLSSNLIWFILVYTLVISIRALFDILIRGLQEFKLQAKGKIFEMAILGACFLFITFYLHNVTYQSYLLILIGSMVIACVYYFPFVKKYFTGFSYAALKQQLREGRFFMISALLGTIFASSDRLILAKYAGITTLGIYSAYYLASIGIVMALSSVLTNVFLPATAKSSDKAFTKILDHFFLKGFVPLFISISLLTVIFLNIFGKAYPLRADYVLMFTLVATLTFFQNIQNTVILDATTKQYLRYLYINHFINVVTVFYYLAIMQYSVSVNLLLTGYAVNMTLTMIVQRIFIKEMRLNGKI